MVDFIHPEKNIVGDTFPPAMLPVILANQWPGEFVDWYIPPVVWGILPGTNNRPPYGRGITPIWEPWGSLIDDNHNWAAFSSGGASYNLTNGIMNILSGNTPGTKIQYVYWNDGPVPDQVITQTHIRLKLTSVFVTGGVGSDWNLLQINTGGGTETAYLVFDSNNLTLTPPYYSIGDNGGLAQTLLLSDYGITGSIDYMNLYLLMHGAGTANMAIDYIAFLNA